VTCPSCGLPVDHPPVADPEMPSGYRCLPCREEARFPVYVLVPGTCWVCKGASAPGRTMCVECAKRELFPTWVQL
jgi:hypothetical protein